MPQDPNLYGQPPPKKHKKEMELSSSISFTSQLSSLLAAAPSSSAASSSARSRPKSTKPNVFSSSKAKRKGGAAPRAGSKLVLREDTGQTEDSKAERAAARRKMEEKARLYAAMKRGDYIGKAGETGLVDFDRKWAERQDEAAKTVGDSSSDYSSDGDEDDGNDDDHKARTETVEYEDEFGRLRRGTRAEKLRYERRMARGAGAAAELDVMSARPKAPAQLIYGDAVQADAFEARDAQAMEELAAKRDRSATPPPAEHYDAGREIRTKGVGYYAFSRDEDTRKAEMAALEAERANTERLRREREEKVAARKKQLEQRRKEVGERRARKIADSFLDALGNDLAGNNGSPSTG